MNMFGKFEKSGYILLFNSKMVKEERKKERKKKERKKMKEGNRSRRIFGDLGDLKIILLAL